MVNNSTNMNQTNNQCFFKKNVPTHIIGNLGYPL